MRQSFESNNCDLSFTNWDTVYHHPHSLFGAHATPLHAVCITCSTWISQFQSLLGLDEVLTVVLEPSELALIDGQHAGRIVRFEVTLDMRANKTSQPQPDLFGIQFYSLSSPLQFTECCMIRELWRELHRLGGLSTQLSS